MSKEGNEKINNIIEEISKKTKEAKLTGDLEQHAHVAESISEDTAPQSVGAESRIEPKTEELTEKKHQPSNDAIEHEARLRGWRPLDEYSGDRSKWRSADEFLEVGKIYDQHKSVKLERELTSMQQQMNRILEINQKQAERLAQEKADYLEAARLQAIQEGNVEQFSKIDNQLKEVHKEVDTYKQQPTQPNHLYLSFKEKNSEWFNYDTIDNAQLTNLAIAHEKQLIANRPELTREQILELTEQAIKSSNLYLSAHSNRNRDRPSAVTINSPENSTLKKTNKGKTFKDLPLEMQRTINNMYASVPKMKLTKDQYAQQLFDIGAVNNE
jgi:hypothetical protein